MNAIILAAGLGTRLRPLTNDRPKCMVEVCGEPMVERQIRFLKEVGIDDITLVSGYMAEKLDYLAARYGVRIIPNPKYDTVNNIYSLYVAQEFFGDTYVLEGDVYMHRNCLQGSVNTSSYFAVSKKYTNEWGLITDGNNVLQGFNIGDGEGPIMSGISYWTREDALKIKQQLNATIQNGSYENLFWDNIVVNIYKRLSPIKVTGVQEIYEIDTQEDLNRLQAKLLS